MSLHTRRGLLNWGRTLGTSASRSAGNWWRKSRELFTPLDPIVVEEPAEPASAVGKRTRMYRTMQLNQFGASQLGWYTSRIYKGRHHYEEVEDICGVPSAVVGTIHGLECGFSFDAHLHNGDPLARKTVQVPRGRPMAASWTWETSAADAMRYDQLDKVDWTNLEEALYALEAYNGLGYERYHPECNSPYLWSGCQHYDRGKYVADGKWSPTAISGQLGAAVILHAIGWNL